MTRIAEAIERALSNAILQEGVKRASRSAEERVPRILEDYPFLRELAREVEEVRRMVVERLEEFVNMAIEALKRVNAKPYLASDAEDARKYVGRLVGKGKLVVLSKSMTAEEIGLREYLERLGNEVWETDLGQFLVQLEEGKPMHSVAPAIHLTREAAAKLVERKLGVRLRSGSPEEIAAAVRRFLREKFVRADVGISGANAIAADSGAIIVVENEGNARLVTGLPPVHIVVAGVEKIVPTLLDALKTAIVQAAYAGMYPPTYLNVIAGPSSTADIEHHRVYGAHGPRELHVVLIDNGRLEASKHPILREQLRCVRCGRCQFECPVWQHTANYWGGRVYGGPMGLGWTAITESVEAAAEAAMFCLQCRRCDEVCPMRIPLSGIAAWLKRQYVSRLLG